MQYQGNVTYVCSFPRTSERLFILFKFDHSKHLISNRNWWTISQRSPFQRRLLLSSSLACAHFTDSFFSYQQRSPFTVYPDGTMPYGADPPWASFLENIFYALVALVPKHQLYEAKRITIEAVLCSIPIRFTDGSRLHYLHMRQFTFAFFSKIYLIFRYPLVAEFHTEIIERMARIEMDLTEFVLARAILCVSIGGVSSSQSCVKMCKERVRRQFTFSVMKPSD